MKNIYEVQSKITEEVNKVIIPVVGRVEKLKLNKRLLFYTRLLIEVKSLNAVIQLFYLSRGLDIYQFFYISIIWTITVLFFDLPTSYLADIIGRKKCILTGIILTALSTFLMLFAQGFMTFSLIYVLAGIGFAFFQGSDHAMLYDSLKEAGEEKTVARVSGKYFSSQNLAKIFVPLLGAIIAINLSNAQFMVLLLIDLVGIIFALYFAAKLTEPKKLTSASGKRLNIFKRSLKLIATDKILLKFALNRIFVFEAAFLYWRIYQVILKGVGINALFLGIIYSAFQSILFLVLWNSEKVQKKVGRINFVWGPIVISLVALVITIISNNLVILIVSTIPLLVLGTMRDPIFLTQIQARIESFNRATTTSALNIAKGVMDIPILLLAGAMAKNNPKQVLYIAVGLIFLTLIFGRITKKDIISVEVKSK